ncbi:hypothetical protein WA158_001040 [Blastocystis sp. Blastoise]
MLFIIHVSSECTYFNDEPEKVKTISYAGFFPVDLSLQTNYHVVSISIKASCGITCQTNLIYTFTQLQYPSMVVKGKRIRIEFRVTELANAFVTLSYKEDYCFSHIKSNEYIQYTQDRYPYRLSAFYFNTPDKPNLYSNESDSNSDDVTSLTIYPQNYIISILSDNYISLYKNGFERPVPGSFVSTSELTMALSTRAEDVPTIPRFLSFQHISIYKNLSPIIYYSLDSHTTFDGEYEVDLFYWGRCRIFYILYYANKTKITRGSIDNGFPRKLKIPAVMDNYDPIGKYYISFSSFPPKDVYSRGNAMNSTSNAKCDIISFPFNAYKTNYHSYNLNTQELIIKENNQSNTTQYIYLYLHVGSYNSTSPYISVDYIDGIQFSPIQSVIYTSKNQYFTHMSPPLPTIDVYTQTDFPCDECVLYITIKLEPGQFIIMKTNYHYYPPSLSYSTPTTLSLPSASLPALFSLGYRSDNLSPLLLELTMDIQLPIYISISTKEYPTENIYEAIYTFSPNVTCDGKLETHVISQIMITKDASFYCNSCTYYGAIGYITPKTDNYQDYFTLFPVDTPFPADIISLITMIPSCTQGACDSCPPGRDPAANCEECSPGYYGTNCEPCSPCLSGKCDEGIKGSGKCVCDAMHDGPLCERCKHNYFGEECKKCPNCIHGRCDDGRNGNGKCICSGHYDPVSLCSDCSRGYFGANCTNQCPFSDGFPCSNHGKCDEGLAGKGICLCQQDFTGIDCSVPRNESTCTYFCVPTNGYCNNMAGRCSCYLGYYGKSCELSYGNYIFICIVSIVIAFVAIVSGYTVLYYFVTIRRLTITTKTKKIPTQYGYQNTHSLYKSLL